MRERAFEYQLEGKQVVLVLDRIIARALKPLGVSGTPLYGKVHKVEEHGVWLDNPGFAVCPPNKIVYPEETANFCHAHVFIPADAILALATFPGAVAELEDDPSFHRIGFEIPPASA